MGAQRKTEDQDGRALLTLALVVLTGTAAAAFGRVFEGSAPTLRLVLAAGAATVIAALLERRHLAWSVVASAAGLLLLIALTMFRDTTWYGLPTSSTLGELAGALGDLGSDAVEETTPAPALPSLFAASLIAVWAAAYASHALAARAGSAILALVPPAALLAFAGVVAEDGARFGYAAVFLAASLAVLFTSGVRGLHVWGPVLPRKPRQSLRLVSGPTGRGARRLALAVTAAALAVPWLLPGFRADGVLDLTGGSGGRVSIRPLVDIRPSLLRDPAIELFTVEAERPAYWRLLSLDMYTGRVWRSSDPRALGGREIRETGPLAAPSPFGGVSLSQEIEITGLGGLYLPAALAPVGVQVPGATFRHDPDRMTLVIDEGVPDGLRYTVRSRTASPEPEQLDRDWDFSAVHPKYTSLPSDTPPEVYDVAQQMTAGLSTPYRKALAIQNLLRTFTYDEEAPAGHGMDDLLFFLQSRRGYCEQFAGTMSVLLRALGYPARVAVGFLPGVADEAGVYHVTTEEAHAWVEMFFPGFGWLPFEPTPTRSNPVALSYLRTPTGSSAPGAASLAGIRESLGGGIGGLGARLEALERRSNWDRSLSSFEFVEIGEPTPLWRRIAPWAGALAGAALAMIPVVKSWRRRRLIRRAQSPRARVLAAYQVFELRAGDLGLSRQPGETLQEYGIRLRSGVAFSDGDLERLTGLAGRALYADDGVTAHDAEDVLLAARAAAGDLRRHVGRLRALAGVIRIRPAEPDV